MKKRQNNCRSKCSSMFSSYQNRIAKNRLRPRSVQGAVTTSWALRRPNSCNKTSKTPRHSACRRRARVISVICVICQCPSRHPSHTKHVRNSSYQDCAFGFGCIQHILMLQCDTIRFYSQISQVEKCSAFKRVWGRWNLSSQKLKHSRLVQSCRIHSIYLHLWAESWLNEWIMMNHEFIIYIYRFPLERPAQSGWPGQDVRIHWMSWISLFSLEWRWVKYVKWKSWKQRSVWNQKASLGNQAHCSEESKAIWHLTVTVPPGKYGALENRIMTSGCTENANKNLPRKWWHSPNLRLLDSNIGRWFEPSERLGHWENPRSKAYKANENYICKLAPCVSFLAQKTEESILTKAMLRHVTV